MVTGVVLAGFKGQSDRRVPNTSVLSVFSFLLIGIPVVWLTQVYSQQRMVLAAASPGAMVSEVAFSPDGRMLATLDGQLSIWDLASGKRIHSRSLSNSLRSSLAFSPDGKLVAASNQNGSKVILWNIKSGQEWIISQKQVNDLAFSPDGSLLAIGGK